jgi:hypothetical protein
MYLCTSDSCLVSQVLIELTDIIRVLELNVHHEKHAPIPRASYPWSRAQQQGLITMCGNDCSKVIAMELQHHLDQEGLLRGITKKEIRGWLKQRRGKTSTKQISNRQERFQKLISDFESQKN